jgi:flagellar biosynthesis protein FliP
MSLGQLNVDGELLCGFFFLPFFILDLVTSSTCVSIYDIMMANAFVVMNLVGNVMFSYGIKYGYAGRI